MTQMTKTTPNAIRRRLPFVAIVAAALFGAIYLRDYLSFEMLRANRELLIDIRDSHYLLTVLGFVATYIAIVTFSLPGATVVTLTGGFLFTIFPGTLFNVVAATTGASLIFLAARRGFGERLAARLDQSDGTIRRIKRGLDENQWSMLFVIRLVPAVPFFIANLIPAFLEVPLYRFVISTFLGIIPGAIVYTAVGAGLGEVFARGESPDLGVIFEPAILLPLLGLIVLACLPVVVKMRRGRKGA